MLLPVNVAVRGDAGTDAAGVIAGGEAGEADCWKKCRDSVRVGHGRPDGDDV